MKVVTGVRTDRRSGEARAVLLVAWDVVAEPALLAPSCRVPSATYPAAQPPPAKRIPARDPSVSSPKSVLGTSHVALVFPRSWKLSVRRLGITQDCLEELLWLSPDPGWHAIQRACDEFSGPASVRPELLTLG